MALFRRKDKEAEPTVEVELDPAEVLEEPGPKDSGGEGPPSGYVDLGSLYLPPIPGMQVRAQFEEDGKTLNRIQLVVGTSGIRVSVAAAPRSGGVWPELLDQLAKSVEQQGGTSTVAEGRYGEELQAKVPVQLPNGKKGFTPVRFLGIEGPRWIVRLDVQGPAASGDAEQEELCYQVIDNMVVNRGPDPRVRLSLLPFLLPQGGVEAGEG